MSVIKRYIIIILLFLSFFAFSFYLNNYKQTFVREQEEKVNISKMKESYIKDIKKTKQQTDLNDKTNEKNEKIIVEDNKNQKEYVSLQKSNSKDIAGRKNGNHKNNHNNDKDCIIEIDEIGLSKIVYNGNNRQKHLDNYELVTATSDMNYSSGGNYIICGHASRLYGHSLNRLKEVHKYALIRIWANKSVDEYVVDKVYFEDMDKTDEYCRQTNKDQITIVSCARYISSNSYIIVKANKKK